VRSLASGASTMAALLPSAPRRGGERQDDGNFKIVGRRRVPEAAERDQDGQAQEKVARS